MVDIIKVRYLTEWIHRKKVKGYGFWSFVRKFDDKYGKNLMDTAAKTGIDAGKTAYKRAVQKTAETAGDLIGNIIVDKINLVGKTKSKGKKMKDKKYTDLQKKESKLLINWDCFKSFKSWILKNYNPSICSIW